MWKGCTLPVLPHQPDPSFSGSVTTIQLRVQLFLCWVKPLWSLHLCKAQMDTSAWLRHERFHQLTVRVQGGALRRGGQLKLLKILGIVTDSVGLPTLIREPPHQPSVDT